MNAPTTAQSTQKTAPVYTILDGDFMIDAPVSEVWPHVMEYPTWQNFSINRHISGPHRQEGEVVYLKKDEAGSSATAYYARTIKVEPGRRVIWKTYPEAGHYFGIVEFLVEDVQGKTRFTYHVLYENTMTYNDEAELTAFSKHNHERFETLFKAVFPKLKKLLEKSA